MKPEVVPAAEAATMPGGAVAARYWAEVDPSHTKIALFPIHEGNVIYRGEEILSAVNYQYAQATQENPGCTPGGTCTPPANQVTLFTPQTTVTFVHNGNCVKDGVTFTGDTTCGGFYQAGNACTTELAFCGDIELTSNYTFGGAIGALPDVVLDLGNVAGDPNSVQGCVRNTTLGGQGGLCSDDGPAKTAAATSNFVPQIVGSSRTLPCAYCYGNKTAAGARPGLQNAVISGASADTTTVNDNKVVLRLTNEQNFNLTFIVYYANPALNAPGLQLAYSDANNISTTCIGNNPTRVLVRGGGFGPPAECLTASAPATCPVTGGPAAGYTMSFAGLAGQSPLEWSDTQIRSQNVDLSRYGCPVTLTTPVGTITTDDDVKLCSGVIRTWTPAGYLGRSRVGGGVTNNFIVVMGGLSQTNTASGTNTIQAAPLPRCSGSVPDFTTLSTTLPAGAGLWAAASTSASDGIYYVGGANSGTTCSATALRLSYSGGATATITALPNLPVQLCHATAVTLFDQTSGAEYVVVTGGLTLPVFRVPNSPAPSNADLAPLASYVWTVGGAAWTTVNGTGIQRWNMGGAGYKDTTATNNKAVFAGGATTVSNSAPAVTNVDILQISGGALTYSPGPALPFARSAPAVAVSGTSFFLQGGATSIQPQTFGRLEMIKLGAQPLGGSWTTVSTGAKARQGHLLVLSNFAETLPADTLARLIMVGGSNGLTLITEAEEFNP